MKGSPDEGFVRDLILSGTVNHWRSPEELSPNKQLSSNYETTEAKVVGNATCFVETTLSKGKDGIWRKNVKKMIMNASMLDLRVDMRETEQQERNQHRQNEVNSYFENALSFWEDIYERDTLEGRIYQRRKKVALSLVDELSLPSESNILEIGCGAGLLTMDLAKRYRQVKAIDGAVAMVNVTRQKVDREGLQHVVCVERGDAYCLQSAEKTFNLVVALGVIPWLHSPDLAMKEMVRVLKPGGYIVVSSDNRHRLSHLIDPRLSPGLAFLRTRIRELLIKLSLWKRKQPPLPVKMYSIRECDDFLLENGFRKIKGVTVGFGPFSFFGKSLFPERVGTHTHEFLQNMSDRRIPPFRSLGSHYLVVARKS